MEDAVKIRTESIQWVPEMKAEYVSFVGTITPSVVTIPAKTWNVRATAFGVYKLQNDIINGNNWYCHTVKNAIGMWFCKTNQNWVIGWAVERFDVDPPIGWLLKGFDTWMCATEESWISLPEVSLFVCASAWMRPLGNLQWPCSFNEECIVRKRLERRMQAAFNRFLDNEDTEVTGDVLERLLGQYTTEETTTVKRRFSVLKRKASEYSKSVIKTQKLFDELKTYGRACNLENDISV